MVITGRSVNGAFMRASMRPTLRSVIVNLGSVSHVVRGENETATIHPKGMPETLPVSRAYLHMFRQM